MEFNFIGLILLLKSGEPISWYFLCAMCGLGVESKLENLWNVDAEILLVQSANIRTIRFIQPISSLGASNSRNFIDESFTFCGSK